MAQLTFPQKKLAAILTAVFFLLFAYGYRSAALLGAGTLRDRYLEWPRLEARRFTVRFSPADRSLAELVGKEADKAAAAVAELLPHDWSAEKPWLIIIPDQAALQEAFGWGEGSGALGVYLADTIKVLSPRAWHWLPAEDRVASFRAEGPLVHEYTHYVLDQRTGGNYPYWFSEGLAQLLEYKINGYQWVEEGSSPADGIFTPQTLDSALNRPESQARAYRQALSLVAYLESIWGVDGLNRLIDALGQGVSFDRALLSVYGFDRAELWQLWEADVSDNRAAF